MQNISEAGSSLLLLCLCVLTLQGQWCPGMVVLVPFWWGTKEKQSWGQGKGSPDTVTEA